MQRPSYIPQTCVGTALLLFVAACGPNAPASDPSAPAQLGPDTMVEVEIGTCAFCHGEWRPADVAPSDLAGQPTELGADYPLITVGDPLRSAIFLKATGLHAMLDLPGDIMIPSNSAVPNERVSIAHLGAWIEGRSEPWDLPETLGNTLAYDFLVANRCEGCHDRTGAPSLRVADLLTVERSERFFRPMLIPGRPWDSALYRLMVLKHGYPWPSDDDADVNPDLFDLHALRVVFTLMAPSVALP